MTGTGIISDPYIITTRADLEAVNDHLDAYYELGADINLAGAAWIPLYDSVGDNYFSGHFDGKNHVIGNMALEIDVSGTDVESYNWGLFAGVVNAVLSNVYICKATMTIHEHSVGLEFYDSAFFIGRVYSQGLTTLTNCHATGTIIWDYETEGDLTGNIGGLVGYVDVIPFVCVECSGNLTIRGGNADASSRYNIGGMIGYAYAGQPDNYCNLTDCKGTLTWSALASSTATSGTNWYDFGGLMGGTACYGTWLRCRGTVNIVFTVDGLDNYEPYVYDIGGLVGYVSSYTKDNRGSLVIQNCSATGHITLNVDVNPSWVSILEIGGFAGTIRGASASQCSADTDILITSTVAACVSTQIGGFIGENIGGIYNYAFDGFQNCYAIGNVTVPDLTLQVGGFCGYYNAGTYSKIDSCYSAVVLTAPSPDATIVGFAYGGGANVTNCYFDYTLSPFADASASDQTTVEMQIESTFTGWDFDTIWNIASGTYPFLRTEFVTLTDRCSATIVKSFPWWKFFRMCKVKEAI